MWRYFQKDISEKQRPTLNVDAPSHPKSLNHKLLKRRKEEVQLNTSILLPGWHLRLNHSSGYAFSTVMDCDLWALFSHKSLLSSIHHSNEKHSKKRQGILFLFWSFQLCHCFSKSWAKPLRSSSPLVYLSVCHLLCEVFTCFPPAHTQGPSRAQGLHEGQIPFISPK